MGRIEDPLGKRTTRYVLYASPLPPDPGQGMNEEEAQPDRVEGDVEEPALGAVEGAGQGGVASGGDERTRSGEQGDSPPNAGLPAWTAWVLVAVAAAILLALVRRRRRDGGAS